MQSLFAQKEDSGEQVCSRLESKLAAKRVPNDCMRNCPPAQKIDQTDCISLIFSNDVGNVPCQSLQHQVDSMEPLTEDRQRCLEVMASLEGFWKDREFFRKSSRMYLLSMDNDSCRVHVNDWSKTPQEHCHLLKLIPYSRGLWHIGWGNGRRPSYLLAAESSFTRVTWLPTDDVHPHWQWERAEEISFGSSELPARAHTEPLKVPDADFEPWEHVWQVLMPANEPWSVDLPGTDATSPMPETGELEAAQLQVWTYGAPSSIWKS